MAYTYPTAAVGTIFLTTLRFEQESQRLLNTYHFRLVGNSSNLTIEGVSNAMNTWFGTATVGLYATNNALRTTGCTLLDAQIQAIHPTRYAAKGYALNAAGLVTPEAAGIEICNVAAVLTRRAVVASRRGVSSLHVPLGINQDTINNGELEAAYQALVTNHGNAILNTTSIGSGVTLEPVIYHRGADPVYDVIGTFIVQPEVRVMRRRTVRVGI